ncbi:hypothetical protein T12_16097 [Trichinella patagoniensis]|uniref:Uncharacterized protein n=1 Tax=Trichinella patagoniensis TaxID=990121 RepID=A0A0V1AF00_9BILA|nr:hypothetical protein T12_16097 [Trichinella patagoniensis]
MAQEDAGIQAVSNRRQLMNQSVCHDPEAGYNSEYNETPGKTVRERYRSGKTQRR